MAFTLASYLTTLTSPAVPHRRSRADGWADGVPEGVTMARITYDDQTAAAYRAVREIPRDGLEEWRDAVRRHLSPVPGMTLVDIGAGTGQFAAAFGDWFGLSIIAVEPSAAMRAQIPRRLGIQVLEGDASALPLPHRRLPGRPHRSC